MLYIFIYNIIVYIHTHTHAYSISKSAIPIQLWKKHPADLSWRNPSNLSGHHAPELSSWRGAWEASDGEMREAGPNTAWRSVGWVSGHGLPLRKPPRPCDTWIPSWDRRWKMAAQEIPGAGNLDTVLFLLWFPASVSLLSVYINFKVAYEEMGWILTFSDTHHFTFHINFLLKKPLQLCGLAICGDAGLK